MKQIHHIHTQVLLGVGTSLEIFKEIGSIGLGKRKGSEDVGLECSKYVSDNYWTTLS